MGDSKELKDQREAIARLPENTQDYIGGNYFLNFYGELSREMLFKERHPVNFFAYGQAGALGNDASDVFSRPPFIPTPGSCLPPAGTAASLSPQQYLPLNMMRRS